MTDPTRESEQEYCYLTTRGRRTGTPHTIEIWFTMIGSTVYLISGGGDRSDWVRNLRSQGTATLRIGEESTAVIARLPLAHSVERTAAVHALYAKYGDQTSSHESDWERDGYIVALDHA